MNAYETLRKSDKGAWVVHHAQKTAATQNASAEFPAIDAAGKASSLLSQFASSEQSQLPKSVVDALAKAAGINPKTELESLLGMLKRRRVIDMSQSGDISILGLTTAVTVQQASDIFDEQDPTSEERAAILLADIASDSPQKFSEASEFIGDEFRLSRSAVDGLLERSEMIGFVDGEKSGDQHLLFNGNIFRRDNISKVNRVLSSISTTEKSKVNELDERLGRVGCLAIETVEKVLGTELFDKLRAAGMYDVNHVINDSGEYAYVTRPAAFHKFNDPLADDAFDLAKALVAALTYGMTLRSSQTGRISMISALLSKLINGGEIGPATAIGEDYKVLEMKGVIQTRPGPRFGYLMRLKKKDIGEMALAVLTRGEAASANALDRPFEGAMSGYKGPEETRNNFRRKRQTGDSKKLTGDILAVLRTKGTL